jgi:hypothetical protein
MCYFVFRRAVIDYRLIKARVNFNLKSFSVADFAQTLVSKIKLLLIVSALGPENSKYSDENIISIFCDWYETVQSTLMLLGVASPPDSRI